MSRYLVKKIFTINGESTILDKNGIPNDIKDELRHFLLTFRMNKSKIPMLTLLDIDIKEEDETMILPSYTPYSIRGKVVLYPYYYLSLRWFDFNEISEIDSPYFLFNNFQLNIYKSTLIKKKDEGNTYLQQWANDFSEKMQKVIELEDEILNEDAARKRVFVRSRVWDFFIIDYNRSEIFLDYLSKKLEARNLITENFRYIESYVRYLKFLQDMVIEINSVCSHTKRNSVKIWKKGLIVFGVKVANNKVINTIKSSLYRFIKKGK